MKKFFYSLFFTNLFIIFFFWWDHSGVLLTQGFSNILLAFGRLAGLLAVYAVLMQFVLIGRAVWVEKTFGLDRLSRVHRLNGQLSIFFIVLHPILLTISYAMMTKVSWLTQFMTFITSYHDVLQACIALILFLIIVVSSITIVRRKLQYETWYIVHLLTYFAVLFAWGHQLTNGEDFLANRLFVTYWYVLYIVVLGNFFFFHVFHPIFLYWRHRFYVEKIVHESDTVVSVYIAGKQLEKFHIQPGQFVVFRPLTAQYWYQGHPFSLSKVANGKSLRISIKNIGDFTAKVDTIALGTPVSIDGPFGIFTQKKSQHKNVLFLAGGIGITPIRSMIEGMTKQKKNIVLLYSNKEKEDVVFKKELDALQSEFGFRISYFLSQKKSPGYTYGRIDRKAIEHIVKDVHAWDVYVCGPVRMLHHLRRVLTAIGIPKKAVHYEEFSY